MLSWQLTGIEHLSKCFIRYNSFNPHNKPMRWGYYYYNFMDEDAEAQSLGLAPSL